MIVAIAKTQFGTIPVEVLDIHTCGRKTASIRSLHGKPFVGGKYPTRTEYWHCPVDDLEEVHLIDECTCNGMKDQACDYCKLQARLQSLEQERESLSGLGLLSPANKACPTHQSRPVVGSGVKLPVGVSQLHYSTELK